MKRLIMLLAVLAFIWGEVALAQPTAVLGPGLGSGRINYFQTTNRTLSPDTVYFITGTYFVDGGARLTIPAGTVLKGDTASSMVIRPGARIYATGTAANPIVFTSMKPAGQQLPGDWGGLVVLGNAPTNQTPAPQIEGGIIPGTYGGASAGVGDPHDTSGVLQYVRIEFGGYRYQLNNEINGLTCGGVGDGTVIDHVQVSYSYDDSFEFFGGTVTARYLVAFGGTDDDFDTDFGFSGKLQFCFGYRDPYTWDPTGESNGFESDNMEPSSGWTTNPRTHALMSNATLIGPRRTTATALVPGQRFQYGFNIRRGTEFSVYNSIVMGFPGGYSLRDDPTLAAANADILQGRNICLQANADAGFKVLDGRVTGGDAALATWIQNASYSNLGTTGARQPDAIGLVSMSNFTAPDPRPTLLSEATGSASFTGSLISGDPFFTVVTYRGAFDPNQPLSSQWIAGWTKFDYSTSGSTSLTIKGINSGGTGTSGWNLVSVPRGLADYSASTVFPGAEVGSPIDDSLIVRSAVKNGVGYWSLWVADRSIVENGQGLPGTSYSVPANGIPAGTTSWRIFGGPSISVPVEKVVSTVAGRIEPNTIYGYNGINYQQVLTGGGTIDPGKGYWILLNGGPTGAAMVLSVGQ